MKKLFLFIFLAISIGSGAQKQSSYVSIQCKDLDGLAVTPLIVVGGFVQKEVISKKSLDSNDLYIVLRDTSIHVIGFNAAHDCDFCSLIDMPIKTFFGNKISRTDSFIRGIRPRNQLYLECINVEKGGKRYIITSVLFDIVE